MQMKIFTKAYVAYSLMMVSLVMSFGHSAWGEMKEVMIPETILEEIHYLLSFVGPEGAEPTQFSVERIKNVLHFMTTPKRDDILYHADRLNGAPSAYYQFDIQRNLASILRLNHNPDIPAVLTAPSTIRMSKWTKIDGKNQPLPRFWEFLSDLESPRILKGVEHIVNSPDTNSGTYYEYDLNKTLILSKYRGRNLFIITSKQDGVSDVGRQGIIVGSDENWDYLYSDKPGLSKSGLKWIHSHMYDSYSVTFYYEIDASRPLVRFASFKWVRAGWGEINFVRRTHIYNGFIRFSNVLREILESPAMPDASSLAQTCKNIKNLPDGKLREIVKAYLDSIENRCLETDLLSENQAQKLFKKQNYLISLNREEMEAVVFLLYLKKLLGKNENGESGRFPLVPTQSLQ